LRDRWRGIENLATAFKLLARAHLTAACTPASFFASAMPAGLRSIFLLYTKRLEANVASDGVIRARPSARKQVAFKSACISRMDMQMRRTIVG